MKDANQNNHNRNTVQQRWCSRCSARRQSISTTLLIVSLLIVVGLIPTVTFAQNHHTVDSYNGHKIDIKIHFRYDDSNINSSYMENLATLNLLDSIFNDKALVSTLDTIAVVALSSPEGSYEYNTRLSERRMVSLESFMTSTYPSIPSSLWYFSAEAENWVEFREMIVSDPNIPNKTKVLSIIDSDTDNDRKEWLLKIMDDGKPWQHIKEHILPHQRYGASVVLIPHTDYLAASDPIIPINQSYSLQSTSSPQALPQLTTVAAAPAAQSKAIIAIKSNLIWDLASIINVGLEIPIGNRFSIVGEVTYPWWRNWEHNLTMQIESYHAEAKYWLGDRSNRDQLTGWSAGIYGGWGLYDVQIFSETGAQGDFFDVGGEIGYAHAIGKNLHLEYTIGLGYISTDYNDYFMAYDTDEYNDIKVIPYPWMNNKLSTILPTRCGISLVWVIKSNK